MLLIEDTTAKVARVRSRFKNVIRHEELEILRALSEEKYETFGCDDNYLDNVGHGVDKKQKREKIVHEPRQTGYALKLFDRIVDVAQYQERTPLYPICRAWARNNPDSRKRKLTNITSGDDCVGQTDNMYKEVHTLPEPQPLPYNVFGHEIKIRVPRPLPPPEAKGSMWDYIDAHAIGDDLSLPSPATLFQEHLHRWQHVRHRWKKASAANERRYKASFDVIRKMYTGFKANC